MEDINAAFGEPVAVHYYGASAEEEMAYAKEIAKEEDSREDRTLSIVELSLGKTD